MKQDMIVILDLGSTENTVIARQIRDLGVYSEIHPHDITVEELQALDNVKGIILNGGENRVVDGQEVQVRDELYGLGYPTRQSGSFESWSSLQIRRNSVRSSAENSSVCLRKRQESWRGSISWARVPFTRISSSPAQKLPNV